MFFSFFYLFSNVIIYQHHNKSNEKQRLKVLLKIVHQDVQLHEQPFLELDPIYIFLFHILNKTNELFLLFLPQKKLTLNPLTAQILPRKARWLNHSNYYTMDWFYFWNKQKKEIYRYCAGLGTSIGFLGNALQHASIHSGSRTTHSANGSGCCFYFFKKKSKKKHWIKILLNIKWFCCFFF